MQCEQLVHQLRTLKSEKYCGLALGWMMASVGLGFASAPDAACPPCSSYQTGIIWGTTAINALSEASGLAASGRNAGVLWTHNDGSRKRVYAVSTNGATLSSFTFTQDLGDLEDMAVGSGPAEGVSYLYFGDIGGNSAPNDVRSEVQILRVPEPFVDPAWAQMPRAGEFAGTESFTLLYPDGSYDAETLMVDPVTGDILVVTKQDGAARLYRANLNAAPANSSLKMTFAGVVPFAKAAGGDISSDGKLIALRREETAMIWGRCNNEAIEAALTRAGQTIPVIGKPAESNGEAIAFLREGSGYVTISEGDNQPIYFFRSVCPTPPQMRIVNREGVMRIEFDALASRRYILETRSNLVSGAWLPTGDSILATNEATLFFEYARSTNEQFFRVVKLIE